MEHLHMTLPRAMRGGHAKDSFALLPLVVQSVKAGDVIAVKGSHGSNMRPIVDGLTSLTAAARPVRAANGH
jgi:UDP-N-acetylmuramoyl-tripeptide--D-alanyl-D-alanine ligase